MNCRTLTTALGALLLIGGAACDQSKPELDKTKAELATVTSERDNMKSQLDQANAKVTALQQQVNDLQAKVAAAAAAPAPAPAPAAEEKKPAAKHAAGKKEEAKPLTKEQKQEIQANPEARRGKGAF
jgi:chromosome segregation ATPase